MLSRDQRRLLQKVANEHADMRRQLAGSGYQQAFACLPPTVAHTATTLANQILADTMPPSDCDGMTVVRRNGDTSTDCAKRCSRRLKSWRKS
jgi:hypothetical protein